VVDEIEATTSAAVTGLETRCSKELLRSLPEGVNRAEVTCAVVGIGANILSAEVLAGVSELQKRNERKYLRWKSMIVLGCNVK